MARADRELRRAMTELVGGRVTVVETRTVTPEAVFELFGTTAAIASAAGLPTGAVARAAYKAAHPRAGKKRLDAEFARAQRERRSFMRELQRYRQGSRSMGPRYRERLAPVQEQEVRRRRSLSSLSTVARTMVDGGVTVPKPYDLLVAVSSDERWRYGLPTVDVEFPIDTTFVEDVAAGDWGRAAVAFFDAWALSYGVGRYVTVTEAEGLSLKIGVRSYRAG